MRPGLRMVLAGNPSPMTLDGTRTWIVGRERPAVIDPGPDLPGQVEALVRELNGAIPVILLTHGHEDHAGAAAGLAAMTGARILAHPEIPDGVPIQTDAGDLHVLSTPGHTPDHLAFRWSPGDGEGDALFVGDAFMGGLDTVLIAPPEGELASYLRTLELVESLAPETLYPAHGEPIRDGAAAARRYREHRLARVAQVEEALRGGPARAEALVDTIYGNALDPALRWAAAASVAASGDYLVRLGRARLTGSGSIQLL